MLRRTLYPESKIWHCCTIKDYTIIMHERIIEVRKGDSMMTITHRSADPALWKAPRTKGLPKYVLAKSKSLIKKHSHT